MQIRFVRICMYVCALQYANELWNTTTYVSLCTSCSAGVRCVCVWGGMIMPVTTPSMNLSRWTVDTSTCPCIGCGTTLAVCSIGGVTKCALITFLEERRLPDMCNQRKITLGSTVASAVNMWDRCTLYHLLCKCTNPPWL